MRQAARKVALENSRLRAFLASRGVTNEEVSHYLASFDDQASGCLPTMALAPQSSEASLRPLVADLGLWHPERDMPRCASPPALDTRAVAADANVRQTCCGPATQCSLADERDVQGLVAEPFPRAGAASPSLSPLLPSTTAPHLEMSCTAAAQIIANMCRDRDKELAREALGCSGPEECRVKNTLVFQLLDSAERG